MVAACSKKFPIKRTALWDMKNKKKTFSTNNCFFFKGSQKHRSFSWPYVEPPSKLATASNNQSLDDDAIEIETSEIVQQQKF